MTNEKSTHQLNDVKRKVLYYIFGLAIVSLIIKYTSGTGIRIRSSMAEIYVIVLSIFFISTLCCRTLGIPEKDPHIKVEQSKWIHIGFHVIIWGMLGFHFISFLFNPIISITESFSYFSFFTLTGFIIAEVIIKKHHSYINYNIIETDRKNYFKAVLFQISRLWFIALGYAVLVFSLSLTLDVLAIDVINIWMIIMIIFIWISIQYLFLSIYERIDYEEKGQQKEEVPFYLTKKTMLFGMSLIIFAVLQQVVTLLNICFYVNNHYQYYQGLNNLSQFFTLWWYDFAVVGILFGYTIYSHLKKIPFKKPTFIKIILVVIWLQLIYRVLNSSVLVYQYQIINAFNLQSFNQISDIMYLVGIIVNILLLVSAIIFYPFMHKNHFPALKTTLIIFILPFAYIIAVEFFYPLTGTPEMISIKMHIILLIQYALMGILSCFVFNKLCITPLDKRLTEANILLKKELL